MATFVLSWAVAAIALQEAPATKPAPPPPSAESKTASPPAENSTTVSGVTVTTARPEMQTSIDRRTYSVANDLQAQTGNIGDALRNIPSVQVDVNGNLSLRGDPNVTVLLDGQPSSQFSGDNLAQALQSLPANRIDKIEVITNPSAAFRADGVGIINLISKKVTAPGPTGSVQAMVGNDGRARLSVTGNRGGPRLRLSGDLSLTHQFQREEQDNRSSEVDPASQAVFESRDQVTNKADLNLANAHAGAEYDIDKRTRWSGDIRGNIGRRNIDGLSNFTTRDPAGVALVDLDRTADVEQLSSTVQATTQWRRQYAEGNDLRFSGVFERFQTNVDRTDDTITHLPVGQPPETGLISSDSLIRQVDLKADYNRPAPNKAKLQLGYELFYALGDFLNDAGEAIGGAPALPDPAKHDKFEGEALFNEAYVTYERPYGKLTALAGLRGQMANIDLSRVTQAIDYAQNYAHLYPTLHLSYDAGEGRRVNASYSRRVNRPIFADVNPYRISTSPQSAFEGNPDLKPEMTDSFELGFEHRKGPSSLLATLYFRSTTDAFTTLAEDLGDGVLLAKRVNAGERQAAGLELVKTGKFTAKLTYNLSANLYWTEIRAPNLGFAEDSSGTTGFGRANLNWQATPKDFIQLNLFANGKVFYPQGYSKPTGSGNIGWRHKVDDKVSWMVVAQDPFETLRSHLVLDGPGGTVHRDTRVNSRVFTFTIVSNFGGGKTRDPNFEFAPGGNAGAGPL